MGPVSAGDILAGKYRVDRILGVGGMGIVVAATHVTLDQKVALKFMLPEALRIPALVERFAREARAAVRLKSDHVARVLDVGTLESGSPFMVMEYLDGRDLGSLIESGGAVSIDTAIDFVLQACDAVAEAHSIGIIHRDLKPRNLFLTQRNDGGPLVKVLDFGIAKQSTAADDLALTKTSEVLGSPYYMSPEQLRASRLADERSDIWALGVILYELLTGALPFAAESVTELVAQVLTEHPRPIRGIRLDVPPQLANVIERCLHKEPSSRFQSVAALAAALEPFAPEESRGLANRIARIASGGRPVPAAPESPNGRRKSGGTTGNWWARSEMAGSSRSRTVAVGAVVAVAALGAAVVVAGSMKLVGRPAASNADQPRASTTASATMAPTVAPSVAVAVAPSEEHAAPPMAATGVGPAPASANPRASAPNADAGGGRPGRPRRDLPPPPASSSANEPPAYRTTW